MVVPVLCFGLDFLVFLIFLFLIFLFFILLLLLLLPPPHVLSQHPWNQNVSVVALLVAPAGLFSLQRPAVNQKSAAGPEPRENVSDGVHTAQLRGKVVDHRNGNGKVKRVLGVGQSHPVSHRQVVCRIDSVATANKPVRPVGPDHIQLLVDAQVLAVAAAHVKPDTVVGAGLQKLFHNGPWLVAGFRKMRRYFIVHSVDILSLSGFGNVSDLDRNRRHTHVAGEVSRMRCEPAPE
ncbi:hypothetical protein CLUG_02895 [Clavispora lusitaniae ATCC 42720]|uniref:Uncharacterized protein n=1 Tax=Clavispora lusitaniae (strain ATCC 42720) TaxID=306902 RepID=C4Y2Y2_CLAL4|nr:uncharacterized protein CLUG_02895 [Clavispora lusitaniae ATCC 42720]EEQ38768.1 hypothetical protein CLUG_02895 [Clavispora lusitaniae ATCC 42720]